MARASHYTVRYVNQYGAVVAYGTTEPGKFNVLKPSVIPTLPIARKIAKALHDKFKGGFQIGRAEILRHTVEVVK